MDLCKGCGTKAYAQEAIRRHENLRCYYHYNKEICPCVECIVKPICSSKNKCELYQNGKFIKSV